MVVSNMYETNKIVSRPILLPRYTKRLTRSCTVLVRNNFTIPMSVVRSTLACTAKAFSFCFTYPLESYKLYTQLENRPKYPKDLYQGFSMFVLLATSQCFISYNIFFATIELLKPWVPRNLTYMYASVISCFLSSFIKVPMAFISRNIVFSSGTCGLTTVKSILTKLNQDIYKSSWLTTVLSDIPDSFVKFFVNDWLYMNAPYIDTFARSCITGLMTSFANMPMDYILTQTLCNRKHVGDILCDNFIIKCMTGVQFRMFSCILGNIVFFSAFDTLKMYFMTVGA